MKWYNGFEKLPEDQQKVVVNVRGVQQVATDDAKNKIFRPARGKPFYYIARE
jgi:hypothetical protein